MRLFIKLLLFISLFTVIVLTGCTSGNDNTSTTPPPQPQTNTNNSQTSAPPVTSIQNTTNRVDIVYFHPRIRCGPCLSVELRTQDILDKTFKDAMKSGKLTFQIIELQDNKNVEIIKKYGAISSQLFINTIVDNKENIRHIHEVWTPKLLNDQIAYEQFINNVITQSLKELK